MAWSGKISPDSRIWGSMVMMASWIACPWVSDTVEMSTPASAEAPSVPSMMPATGKTLTVTLPRPMKASPPKTAMALRTQSPPVRRGRISGASAPGVGVRGLS